MPLTHETKSASFNAILYRPTISCDAILSNLTTSGDAILNLPYCSGDAVLASNAVYMDVSFDAVLYVSSCSSDAVLIKKRTKTLYAGAILSAMNVAFDAYLFKVATIDANFDGILAATATIERPFDAILGKNNNVSAGFDALIGKHRKITNKADVILASTKTKTVTSKALLVIRTLLEPSFDVHLQVGNSRFAYFTAYLKKTDSVSVSGDAIIGGCYCSGDSILISLVDGPSDDILEFTNAILTLLEFDNYTINNVSTDQSTVTLITSDNFTVKQFGD